MLAGDWAGALRLQPLVVFGGVLTAVAFGVYSGFLLLLRRVVRVRFSRFEARICLCAAVALAVLNWLYLVRCNV